MKLYKGPEYQAAGILSLILPSFIFVISVLAGVWADGSSIYFQFVAALFILASGLVSMFFLEKRIKKVRSKFKTETITSKLLSILLVNVFLILFFTLVIRTILFKL